jgi:uncharacterized protein (DUF983 family)
VLIIEEHVRPPLWAGFGLYVPVVVLLALSLLPRCKGIILAALWNTKGEGSEP